MSVLPDDSDSWDDYPWVEVDHRPPPKRTKKKKKVKDLNKVKIPTAYRVRYAEDGTKWHSVVDILRPDSPPVEWPEYPDKPLEDDFPADFNWDNVPEADGDPVKIMKKLGLSETKFKIRPTMSKKLKKLEAKIMKLEKKVSRYDTESINDEGTVNQAPDGPPPDLDDFYPHDYQGSAPKVYHPLDSVPRGVFLNDPINNPSDGVGCNSICDDCDTGC